MTKINTEILFSDALSVQFTYLQYITMKVHIVTSHHIPKPVKNISRYFSIMPRAFICSTLSVEIIGASTENNIIFSVLLQLITYFITIVIC